MTKLSGNAWRKFWATEQKNLKRVGGLIARVRTHVAQLHRKNKKAALVELPATYNSALAQISSEFEQSMDNLNGLRPAVSNLLEIVKSPKHLRRKATRRSVRRMLSRLAEHFHDDMNAFGEENEHQRALFSGLKNLYADSVFRGKKTLQGLAAYNKAITHKVRWLQRAIRGSAHLVKSSRNISDLKRAECRNVRHMINVNSVRLGRVIMASSQALEVIADRFHTFKKAILKRTKK